MEYEKEFLELIDELQTFERQFALSNRFNVFEALNMVRQEIRHSRFLAFLLNPKESHGLQDNFLRALLLVAAKNHPSPPVSRLAITITDCSNAVVYCERDHFDITVQIPELKLMFVIENKIDASERQDQLSDYRSEVERRYVDYRFMGLFLTPEGKGGEDEQWSTISYEVIATELERILSTVAPAADVSLAIRHYIEIIRRRIVVTEPLIEACRRIYTQHRAALDLIVEHGQVPVLTEAFKSFLKKNGELNAFTKRPNDVHFVASNWLDIKGFQVADTNRWGISCPLEFAFVLRPQKIFLRLEVGPVLASSGFDRSAFVQKLRSCVNAKDRQATGDLFTRVRTLSHGLSDEPSIDEIAGVMDDLWTTIGGARTAEAARCVAETCAANAHGDSMHP